MSKKSQIAKKNLKRALYLGGGVAVMSSAIGLGVSIPLYKIIQAKLNANISELSDISSYMSELADKLGIAPGQEFQEELANGYQIVYKDGQTQVFRKVGEERSLLLNMNGDGSVGSAGQLSGIAAQKMLAVVSDATTTLGDSADAMTDILSDYKDQAEEESISIESAVTGLTADEIKARNLLSYDKNNAAARAEAEAQIAADPALVAARAEAERVLKEKAAREAALASAKTEQERQAILDKENAAKEAAILAAKNKIRDAYINYIINATILDKSGTKQPIYTGTKPDLEALNEKDLNDKYNEIKEALVAEATRLAQEATTQANMEAAQNGGNASILIKIVSNPSSMLNAIAKSFGYNNGTSNEKPVAVSAGFRKLLKGTAISQGISEASFSKTVHDIAIELGLPESEASNWENKNTTIPTKKLSFSTSLNTYNEEVSSLSKLLVLTVNIHNNDGTEGNGYFLARSSSSHVSQFDKVNFELESSTSSQDKKNLIKTIGMIIQGIKLDLYEQIHIKLFNTLIKVLNSEKINHVSDPTAFQKIGTLYGALLKGGYDKFGASYLSRIMASVGERMLLDGETVNFDPVELVKAVNLVIKHDIEKFPSIKDNDLDSIYVSSSITESYWMSHLYDAVSSHTTKLNGEIHSIGLYTNELSSNNELAKEVYNLVEYEKAFDIIRSTEDNTFGFISANDSNVKKFMTTMGIDMIDLHTQAKNLSSLVGVTPTLYIDHIKQLLSLENENGYANVISSYKELIFKTMLSNKADVTFEIQDMINISQKLGANINLNDKGVADKVSAASGVSSSLGSNNISAADTEKIQDKMYEIIGKTNLTKEQFDEVVKYTDTVFLLFPKDAAGKKRAVDQLYKVLDPTQVGTNPPKIEANISKIIAFNSWVDAILQSTGNNTVTRDEIETYVWTKDKVNVYDTTKGNYDATTLPAQNQFNLLGNLVARTKPDGVPAGQKVELYTIDQGTQRLLKIEKVPDGNNGFISQTTWVGLPDSSGGIDEWTYATGQWTSTAVYDEKTDTFSAVYITNSGNMKLLTYKKNSSGTWIANRILIKASGVTVSPRTINIDSDGHLYLVGNNSAEVFMTSNTISTFLTSGFTAGTVDLKGTPSTWSGSVWASEIYSKNSENHILITKAGILYDLNTSNGTTVEIILPNNTMLSNMSVDQTSNVLYGVNGAGDMLMIDLNVATPTIKVLFNIADLKDSSGTKIDMSALGNAAAGADAKNFRGMYYNPATSEMIILGKEQHIYIPSKSRELEGTFNFLLEL